MVVQRTLVPVERSILAYWCQRPVVAGTGRSSTGQQGVDRGKEALRGKVRAGKGQIKPGKGARMAEEVSAISFPPLEHFPSHRAAQIVPALLLAWIQEALSGCWSFTHCKGTGAGDLQQPLILGWIKWSCTSPFGSQHGTGL